MASMGQTFAVRDTSATTGDNRKTGLSPTWVFLKRLSDGADISSPPTITEIAQGQYRFAFDAEASGEAAGQIDAGASVPNASDRYIDVLLTRDSSRVQTGIGASGCQLDMGQAVPAANTGQTVGDALNAARAQGFGRWALVGTALTIYAADGTTVVRTFTLNDATSPTSRV